VLGEAKALGGAEVKLMDGRFGPYVTDGTTNASVPRGADPMAVTLEEAVTLIEERRARGPVTRPKRGGGGRKKKAATTGAVRKTARKRAVAGAV
jgi:DNA topoisomerase-1